MYIEWDMKTVNRKKRTRISMAEPKVLGLGLALAIISAAICMQIMGQFGTSPNTSLIGAVLVMIVAKIPLAAVKSLRHLERQNYILSMASAAGFAAANCGFIAIAVMFLMGRYDLIMPMAFGALMGSMISILIMGRLFDSRVFPATGAWPMGQAVASVIEAGDEGGKKGLHLLAGLAIGVVASYFRIPAAGVGIAFIADMGAMAALGIGMLLRGHSVRIFRGFDVGESNIAQGVMVGAGIVALVQIIITISKVRKKHPIKEEAFDISTHTEEHAISDSTAKKTIANSAWLFMAGALILALATGIFSHMGPGQAALWVAFAGFTTVVVMMLVGTAAMHSGWAPAFAVVTICLTVGLIIGFPPVPLAVLVGYIGAIGLPFNDTGVGLKTGWLIRGKGMDKDYEAYGRKQQIIIKQIGAVVGIAMAVTFGMVLTRGGVIPPMSVFYAYTVMETVSPALIRELAIWAVPGAVLQAAFGNKRSVGLMLATGLLINNPIFGIAVLAAIAVRLKIGTKFMEVRGPGLIAGDGLFGFGRNIFYAFFGG